tara:strand:- start:724 stop:1185 length:462 start_codon:yes stop_codon:yes gene_type:complete
MLYYFFGIIFIICLDVIFFHCFKKNFISDNFKLSLLFFILLTLTLFYYTNINISFFLIIFTNYLLLTFLHYLIFTGIKKTSPSLFIIHNLKKGIVNKNKLQKLFLKNNFFKKRLTENSLQNLILIKKKKIILSNKGARLLKVFKFLQLILKIQ